MLPDRVRPLDTCRLAARCPLLLPQTVGKLRVRLSCLRPNEQLSSELPLVSERSKGARLAGTVGLTLLVSYSSPVSPQVACSSCRISCLQPAGFGIGSDAWGPLQASALDGRECGCRSLLSLMCCLPRPSRRP